ncbi:MULTISPECIES: TetR/AcrR family transcriptional regulator [Mycolicibacterium]|uniref:TetR family transcriptional regulator n=1 Tax=Mycolicibacterium neoaurum TaxID=1795 RepID=A0AAV2WGA4_MYCNE|nr:TetR/AcrR family transcriptional regulator [Mycolicibacterium neoaurum]CDQ43266.1 TetR family transcriptional regulator [Mycolicibacterium neoaurum]
MARTVDPVKHAARRAHIIDAAMTCFAAGGVAATTTAAICAQAGVGSGTFFHYFPTKTDVLVAILEVGTEQTREWFSDRGPRDDPLAVVLDWVRHTADTAADARVPGFIRAVGAVMAEPAVAEALAADDRAQHTGLRDVVRRAQQRGCMRRDLPAPELATWVMVLLDGFLSRLATDPAFLVDAERERLVDAVTRLID